MGLPPRLPVAGLQSANGSAKVGKRRPAMLVDTDREPSHGSVQTYSMATPTKQTGDNSRHYIGTPRADAILSAFMDFGDDGRDADAQDQGPPLDFDEAFEAFSRHENCLMNVPVEANGLNIIKTSCFPGSSDDWSVTGASTRCSLSDDGEHSNSEHAASGEEIENEESPEDEEATDGSTYEDYDSDFEDYSGDEDCGEEECEAAAVNDNASSDALKTACLVRVSSRTRCPSRARAASRGVVARSDSFPRGPRERSSSRPCPRPPATLGQRTREGARQRQESSARRTRLQQFLGPRDQSVERMLKSMSEPLRA